MPTRPWAGDTNFSSGPRAGETTKDQPTDAELLQGLVAGRGLPTNHLNYLLNQIDDVRDAIFGDGSAGDATISSDTNLTGPAFYNELTVESGWFLNTNGYPLFCKRLVIEESALVGRDGNDGANGSSGTGGSGGAAPLAQALGGAEAGGDGADSANPGNNGGSEINSATSGAGGDGGDDGAQGGGFGGTTTPLSGLCGFRDLMVARFGGMIGGGADSVSWIKLAGGSGGGGGGATTGAGGGGGSGGPPVVIFAKELVLEGDIVARGGNGGDGDTNGGGGGGGQGGVVWLVTRRREGNGSVDVSGGAGGAGGGASGDPGTAGDDGIAIELTA